MLRKDDTERQEADGAIAWLHSRRSWHREKPSHKVDHSHVHRSIAMGAGKAIFLLRFFRTESPMLWVGPHFTVAQALL